MSVCKENGLLHTELGHGNFCNEAKVRKSMGNCHLYKMNIFFSFPYHPETALLLCTACHVAGGLCHSNFTHF